VNILDILKEEHREVIALFDEANRTEAEDDRLREIAQEIATKLSMHLTLEERLVYPRLKAGAEDEDDKVDVFEAYTEHTGAKNLLKMIETGRKPDEQFKAEVQVLGENVKHHAKEEESTLFGLARKELDDDELEEIGEAWLKAKQRAQRASSNGRQVHRPRKKSSGSRTKRKVSRR